MRTRAYYLYICICPNSWRDVLAAITVLDMGSRINAARGPRDMDQDLLLALCLQAEEEEVARGGVMAPLSTYRTPVTAAPEKSLSVVDPSWELLDPSPDVRALFLQFNQLFFWGKLAGVEVKWSSRMTLCAGVCSYEGRGGLCSIRLSGPLLKLRPRKDLVETLLHEMIHALLFVTHNDRDHDAHGDEFCKHMRRINGITGAKISVYHDFHDEVDEYRKHWWLCNGPCQKKRPYFGYVKRAMNRAPSANDPWWAEHKQTCGGTFTKVKEPENYSKKGNGKSSLPSTQNPKMGTSQSQKLLEEKASAANINKMRNTWEEHPVERTYQGINAKHKQSPWSNQGQNKKGRMAANKQVFTAELRKHLQLTRKHLQLTRKHVQLS
ncbi:DNA-dependent metalloprotease SPRTN isoform X2 [Ambystoma mexicanum]|uniref:DNA-dependent metalloprotease SPRTN isoform X2 n=1 Tax=Ambystoma mexicanum TaxID=8296 RepID=UPI0037E7BAF8